MAAHVGRIVESDRRTRGREGHTGSAARLGKRDGTYAHDEMLDPWEALLAALTLHARRGLPYYARQVSEPTYAPGVPTHGAHVRFQATQRRFALYDQVRD